MRAAPEEIQQVKRRLTRSLKLRERLTSKYNRLDSLELSLTSPSSPRLDGMPHGNGGRKQDRIATAIAAKVDLETEIKRLEKELEKDGRELAAYFEKLTPRQELICCLRYIDGLSWSETVAALYDGADDWEENPEKYQNTTFKEHGRALAALTEIIPLPTIGEASGFGGDEQ